MHDVDDGADALHYSAVQRQKAVTAYFLTLRVSSYCLLGLQSSIDNVCFLPSVVTSQMIRITRSVGWIQANDRISGKTVKCSDPKTVKSSSPLDLCPVGIPPADSDGRITAHTTRFPCASLMLGQRCRQLTNVSPAQSQCAGLAGMLAIRIQGGTSCVKSVIKDSRKTFVWLSLWSDLDLIHVDLLFLLNALSKWIIWL